MSGETMQRMGRLTIAFAAAGAMLGAAAASAGAQVAGVPAVPIAGSPTTAPAFVGAPAKPDPRGRGWKVPQNPFLAKNGVSNLHNDAYQTDAYERRGPLGRNPTVTSTLFSRNCGSLTFDRQGRIVTICIGISGPILVMLDPDTLDTLATFDLPPRQSLGGDPFLNVSGGGYFFLDQRDRVVVPTTTRHVLVIGEAGAAGFAQAADYDLTSTVPEGVGILSVLPDWRGNIWFAAQDGRVGWIDRAKGAIHMRDLGEEIANSMAVDERGGVFVVTVKALYRLEAGRKGVRKVWRNAYPNSGVSKPGQLSAGSGTTPTVIAGKSVAITDNAARMHVIVYRSGRKGGQEICRRGVFRPGASDTENSLVAFGRSIIVENNFGYVAQDVEAGALTEPGLTRIDVRSGRCRTVWTSQERAPSVVPKASLRAGLLYTYTRPPVADGSQAWYFTALDLDNGRTVWKRLAGAGLGYNNHYAPISIGRGGVAYSGVLGGLVRVADSG